MMRARLFILLAAGCTADGDGGYGRTPTPAGADGGAEDVWDPRYDDLVRAIEDDLAANDSPGVSVAVMEHGVVTFAAAFGSARPDRDEHVTTETLFQIGSTTKMFTATALLQQVERGVLDLDTSLADAYPESEFGQDKSWNDAVAMRHLLTHQGAFYDYFDWTAFDAGDDDLATWHEQLYFPLLWLMNEPGRFWNYSNPNFNIAGLVVEYHDGRYYPDVMAEDVFGPLGMSRTYQRKTEVEADGDYALGVGNTYDANGDPRYGDVLMDDVLDVPSARPAGAFTWTTPTQMMEMARFLMYGEPSLLSDTLRESMTTHQVGLLNTPDDWGYGYGVMVGPGVTLTDGYHEVEVWNHGGNTLSYSSEFWVVPSQDFAISILSSGYGTDYSQSVTTALETLVDMGPPTAAPEYEFDTSRLDDRVGTYFDENAYGEIDIGRVGDDLTISMPLLEAYGYEVGETLYPLSDSVFYVSISGTWLDLTFIGEPDAPSTWLRNRSFVGTRLDGVPPSSAPPGDGPQRRAQIERALREAHMAPEWVLPPMPRPER